jgi:hypothetical protein
VVSGHSVSLPWLLLEAQAASWEFGQGARRTAHAPPSMVGGAV